jgi:hypothetical protein
VIGHGKRTAWREQGDLLAKPDNLLYIAPKVLAEFAVSGGKPLFYPPMEFFVPLYWKKCHVFGDRRNRF